MQRRYFRLAGLQSDHPVREVAFPVENGEAGFGALRSTTTGSRRPLRRSTLPHADNALRAVKLGSLRPIAVRMRVVEDSSGATSSTVAAPDAERVASRRPRASVGSAPHSTRRWMSALSAPCAPAGVSPRAAIRADAIACSALASSAGASSGKPPSASVFAMRNARSASATACAPRRSGAPAAGDSVVGVSMGSTGDR